jgi:hydrogenase expression/formation protein HypC
MCLAVPGKLVERYEAHGLPMGRFDFSGVARSVCLEYLPDIAIGEYALIHVGFAITKMNSDEAEQTLRDLAELGPTPEDDDG